MSDSSQSQVGDLPISEGFILALVASGMACLGTIFKFLLKSRCRSIKICCRGLDCVRELVPPSEMNNISMSPQRPIPPV